MMPRFTLTILSAAFIFLSGACSTSSDPVHDITIDDDNQAVIAQRLSSELSMEEGRLLQAYLARTHPELGQDELPTGITVGEMIQAQQTYEKSQTAPGGVASDDSPAGSQPAATASRPAGGSTPPASSRPAGADEPAAAPARRPVETATVAADTPLQIRLDQALSSESAQSGQTFQAHLESDLKAGDKVVAPRGSRIEGRVGDVEGSGRVKGRARMSLVLKKLFVGDREYDLATNTLAFEAEKGTKDDALKIGIGAAAGAVIGAIAGGGSGAAKGTAIGAGAGTGAVLVTKGEEIEFPAEQRFQFRLREELTLPVVE